MLLKRLVERALLLYISNYMKNILHISTVYQICDV